MNGIHYSTQLFIKREYIQHSITLWSLEMEILIHHSSENLYGSSSKRRQLRLLLHIHCGSPDYRLISSSRLLSFDLAPDEAIQDRPEEVDHQLDLRLLPGPCHTSHLVLVALHQVLVADSGLLWGQFT